MYMCFLLVLPLWRTLAKTAYLRNTSAVAPQLPTDTLLQLSHSSLLESFSFYSHTLFSNAFQFFDWIPRDLCACVVSHSQSYLTLSALHGLAALELLCPWDFHENTGIGCYFPTPKGSSWPRDLTSITWVSCTGRWFLYHCTNFWEAQRFAVTAILSWSSNNFSSPFPFSLPMSG